MTGRWRGAGAFALVATALGILVGRPAVVLVGVFGIALAAYARAGEPPEATIRVDRTVSDRTPDPGDRVRVRVTVRNVGTATIPDLRLADGVPYALPVVAGSGRYTTALRPGKTATYTYTIEARPGRHTFGPAVAICRDLSGSAERQARIDTEAVTLTCERSRSTALPPPLRRQVSEIVGRHRAGDPGSGVTFHSLREYRRSDAIARVDWTRKAKSGDLATVRFDQERSATAVLVVDARKPAYVAPTPEEAPTVRRCVTAAGTLARGLLDGDDRVGLAALAPADCWLAPASGPTHRSRLEATLATSPALRWRPPAGTVDVTRAVARLQVRLPADAQVVFCSPLVDDPALAFARRLDAVGYPVTVLSPDPTETVDRETRTTPVESAELATLAAPVAAVRRTRRVSDLRDWGVPVHEWPATDSFADAVEHRWSP